MLKAIKVFGIEFFHRGSRGQHILHFRASKCSFGQRQLAFDPFRRTQARRRDQGAQGQIGEFQASFASFGNRNQPIELCLIDTTALRKRYRYAVDRSPVS